MKYLHFSHWLRPAAALLILGSRLRGQTTLATFNLTEYFGVNWPVQNIEMKYNGYPPPLATTALTKNGGAQIPYQWIAPSAGGYNGYGCWDTTATNGCILIQDSLSAAPLSGGVPTGSTTNTYTLESGVAPTATVTNPVTVTKGTCSPSGVAGWIISNSLTGFCVPQTQSSPYNYAPVQGIELNSGVWTGAAANTPNLIYNNGVGGTWPNSYSTNEVPFGDDPSSVLVYPATFFTSETTSFIDIGPLKTSVQLSYVAEKPAYWNYGANYTTGGTSTTLQIEYSSPGWDCGEAGIVFLSSTNLPPNLNTYTPYYIVDCTVIYSGSTPATTQFGISTTQGGSPITFDGGYTGPLQFFPVVSFPGTGHLTATLTLYANQSYFDYDWDSDLNLQYFIPMYNEVHPTIREYQGEGSQTADCGYEQPLTITSVVNSGGYTVVGTSSQVNMQNGDQVMISGVGGFTEANGTWYACDVGGGPNGYFLLFTNPTCGSPASISGTYTSGGTAYPVYQPWTNRPQRDAFYNIPYSANQIPVFGQQCSATVMPAMGINYPPNWPDAGFYDFVYNQSGGSSAPVVGIFEGRLSKQFNTSGDEQGQPGWFTSNDHWNSAFNVAQSGSNNCPNSGGTCAFGLEHILSINESSSITHGNFGIFVGELGQIPGPNLIQPIKIAQNNISGPNLSSLYSYTLNYSDPVPQVTGASWASGTETLTLSIPTSLSVGDTINITGFTPSSYDCSSCTVTAIGPGSVSYTLASNPGGYSVAGSIADTTRPSFGWSYPYMTWQDYTNWTALFQNSTSLCSSTGTCSGASGYYNNMVANNDLENNNMLALWNCTTGCSTAATNAFNALYNSGSFGITHYVTSSSWSSGTETLTLGAHNISVGQLVNIFGWGSETPICTSCPVTGVTSTTISYAAGSAPSYTPSVVNEEGTVGVLNELANGEGAYYNGTEYYQWSLNQFQPYFPTCAALIVNINTSTANGQTCRRVMALAASVMWDNDFWPSGSINGNGVTTTGDSGGLQNQIVQFQGYQSAVAAQLWFNPHIAAVTTNLQATVQGGINAGINQYGSGGASLHYQETYDKGTYQPFANMALSGQYPRITFTNAGYPWANHINFLLNSTTPPEPRFGNVRKCPANGDGYTEGTCLTYAGFIAEGLQPYNPAAAGNGMWGWLQGYYPPYYLSDDDTTWWTNPLVPSIAPTLSSIHFPGYWSVERYGFGTSHETSVHFINGDFYSLNGHRHIDDGQVDIYAHNAPLALDWGATYDPDTGASFCHNRIVLDAEIAGNLGAWSNDQPNCAVNDSTTATGQLLTAGNTNFAAFTNSTQSIATFAYYDGSYWQRTVRTMAADATYPVVYVSDQFFNGTCTSECLATSGTNCRTTNGCKVLTWQVMANGNDAVSTPSGNIRPTVRFSAGCQTPAGQAPSNGTVYPLANGLQTFGFTGYTWPSLAAGSINWNLYERPASGVAQFLIGNWGHGCNNEEESAEFAAANASASWFNIGGGSYCVSGNTNTFCEQQDILRIHDTGPFETTITPVTSGTTLEAVSYSFGVYTYAPTGSESYTWGDCDTTANSCYMTFTNGTEQILTTYDANSYSAFGFTASGGAQELTNNGAGNITWTIEDVTTGTRCVTLPPGVWYPSIPVQYNGSQYCYYHGGGAQPTAATVTFTHTPVTLRSVTLDYYAPPGATQVAVKFGSSVNYAALANCSRTCSVTLLAPAGTYTEQHSFLSAGGSVITASQPVTRNY